MRPLILLLLIIISCKMQAQEKFKMNDRVTPPGLHHSIRLKDYNLAFADKKVAHGERMIIAGIVLTSVSIAMLTTGLVLGFTLNGLQYFAVSAASLYVFAPGIGVLGAGIQRKRKWTIVRNDLELNGGIFPSGHIGLALNF